MKKPGLVGGMGTDSTIPYYHDIVYGVQEKVGTLGVFENNPSAYYCYKAAGFQDVQMSEEIICSILGEEWKFMELELSQNRNVEG